MTLKEDREQHGKFREIVITQSDNGDEILYIGEIEGTSMLKTRVDENGEEHATRYHVQTRVDTPEPMPLNELLDWVESGPDELNNELDHTIPEDLGDGVGLTEFYPNE